MTIGETFGRLTVISDSGIRKDKHFWLCQCSCGKTTEIAHGNLSSGNTKSCGCLAIENRKTVNRVHGHSPHGRKSPTYYSWTAMMIRCSYTTHKQWKDYGGRGIVVCDRWKEFSNFLQDMGVRPRNKSLDRYPNPNGNYEPSNCRWATRLQQRHNRGVRAGS